MIGVMGAAGNVGAKVAARLLGSRHKIRALEHRRDLRELREQGVEVVTGDALDADALRRLFAGCDAALVLLPEDLSDASFTANRRTMTDAIRDALVGSGVRHVVALSSIGSWRADAPGPPGQLHAFEDAMAEIPDTSVLVLRSAAYMDYLLAGVPMMRAERVNGSAIAPDVAFPMVATSDVAAVAAERLTRRDFAGFEAQTLVGPEDLTLRDATAALAARLGLHDVAYVAFPPKGVRSTLVSAGLSEEGAAQLVDMQLAWNDGVYLDGVDRSAATVMPTSFTRFLEQALPLETTSEEVVR